MPISSSSTERYGTAWSNGFYGVSLETLAPSSSPATIDTKSQRSIKKRENVLHSIFSPSYPNTRDTDPHARNQLREVKTPVKQERLEMESDSSSKEEFYSPAQFTASSSIVTSPFSAWTSKSGNSNNTFRTLPNIEMLSADFIESCSDVDQLRQIIDVLETEQNCPYLLQLARRRLASIAPDDRKPKTVKFVLSPEEKYNTNSTVHGSKLGSLVYSEDGSQDIPLSIEASCFPQQSGPSSSTRNSREQELSSEIHRLSQCIKGIEESRRKEQKSFLDRLHKITQSRDDVKFQLQTLEKELESSTEARKELLESVESLREDNMALSAQLQVEKDSLEHFRRKAKKMEYELNLKVEELKHELDRIQRDSRPAIEAQKQNLELNKLLRAAQKNLDDASMENAVLLRTVIKAFGENTVPEVSRQRTLYEMKRTRGNLIHHAWLTDKWYASQRTSQSNCRSGEESSNFQIGA